MYGVLAHSSVCTLVGIQKIARNGSMERTMGKSECQMDVGTVYPFATTGRASRRHRYHRHPAATLPLADSLGGPASRPYDPFLSRG